MSWADARTAKIEAQLEFARRRSAYGSSYSPAHELALNIKTIRAVLLAKEAKGADPDLNSVEAKFITQTAGLLLICALTESAKLRKVADALDAQKADDPRQANILKAYDVAIQKAYPPSLAELRETFIEWFGAACWTSDFAVRKTLSILALPLRRSKPGPPVGSKPLIRNQKG